MPIIVLAVILELAGGRDLYWQPNSNWDNPTNWRLGRVPNCGDSVSLTSVRIKSFRTDNRVFHNSVFLVRFPLMLQFILMARQL